MRKIIVLVLLLGLVGTASGWYWMRGNGRTTTFRTVSVERGDLLVTISATGTIEPEEVIDIGAQVQGQIIRFGQDPRDTGSDPNYKGKLIDYSSPVEKDTILAEIDPKLYQAQVDSAEAALKSAEAQVNSAKANIEVAKANIERSEADLGQMKAKLTQSNRDLFRAKDLLQAKAMAVADYDQYQQNFLSCESTLKVGEATVIQNKATLLQTQAALDTALANVAQAKATLDNARINRAYCTIKSPVKGVIVDRRVNIGQTVVSSLNAPSLFLLAKDLKRLQVWASVNEADIGHIHSGQAVTFTVDAHPGRVFQGVVAPDSPRLNASMTQNVVTYTVVVNTDNTDGKLIPYLTATLRFEVSKQSQALTVPNGALRWKPQPQQVVLDERDEYARTIRRKSPGSQQPAEKEKEHRPDQGVLWVEDGAFVRPIKVHVGSSDGLMTEIITDQLAEGSQVVIGESRGTGAVGTKNPFAPKLFGDKK